MKKLLLTSAIVAVSGAAFAEITWSGDAGFYFNTHNVEDGAYNYTTDTAGNDLSGLRFESSITPTASAELESGIKATLAYDLDFNYVNSGALDPNSGLGLVSNEGFPTLTLESSVGKFTVGEVDNAAHALFVQPKMMTNEFAEDKDDLNARIDTTVGGVTVGLNYVAADGTDKASSLDRESYTLGAAGTFGSAKITAAYQLDTNNFETKNSGDVVYATAADKASGNGIDTATYGVSANYEAMGANLTLAYIASSTDLPATSVGYAKTSSIGLGGTYTMANGANLAAYVAKNGAETGTGVGSDWMAYRVQAGFKAMGADITLGYKDKFVGYKADGATAAYVDGKNDPTNPDGTQGVFLDATYEVAPGAVLMAGYDGTDLIETYKDVADKDAAKLDSRFGSYYVGGSYALGGGAKVYLTHSNATETDPAESVKAGTTLGLSLAF